ncbi:MAG: hypothetical protein NZL83_01120 [Candidatus Absconditabacterales bacterium]|nr:hypothetical protein [Candidatus Absconditabacterales bacterium]
MIKKKSDLLLDDQLYSYLSWKAGILLKKFVSRFDFIKPRKYAKHSVKIQKSLRRHIIRARELGLLPFAR